MDTPSKYEHSGLFFDIKATADTVDQRNLRNISN